MNRLMAFASIGAAFLFALSVPAKDKKGVSDVFEAPPDVVYDAAYKFAQRHGTIKYSDDKHMTVSATIYVPGGKWSYRKDYDCTISVEPLEGNKSTVDVIGLYTTKQLTLSDLREKNSPAFKVIEGIHQELERQKTLAKPQSEEVSNSESNKSQPASPTGQTTHSLKGSPATVSINSKPDGADITVDGELVGKTPLTLKLPPGEHTITVGKSGFKTWQWTTTVDAGDILRINPTLESSQN